MNQPRFIPFDALGDAIGLASEGPPLPAPGQWLGSPDVKRALNRANIEAILQEARRVRRRWPLAVCVATGGAVAPTDSAGADLGDIAILPVVHVSRLVWRDPGVAGDSEKGIGDPGARAPSQGGMKLLESFASVESQANPKLLDRNGNDANNHAAA